MEIKIIIIFTSGFICGLFLWLKTGIQNILSEWQMKRLHSNLEKSLKIIDKYIDKSKIIEIEKFMQEKWIPLFIDNYINSKEVIKLLIKEENVNKFKVTLKDFLIVFNKNISIKKIELINKNIKVEK